MGAIVVVGAGIGGLSAAHALKRAGHDVLVLERSPALSAGAGLVLWPNAVKGLDEIGVGAAVREIGAEVTLTSVIDRQGRELSNIDIVAIAERDGAPMLLVERADLHAVLAAGLDEVRCDAAVASVDPAGVTLQSGERIDADAVIGADGIGSVVREHVAPDAQVLDAGKIAIRAVVPVDAGVGHAYEAWGRKELFGIVGLPGARTHWYYEAIATLDEHPDALELVRKRACDFPAPFPTLVEKTDPTDLLVHPIRTVSPLERWTRETVTLLGDAAHAMEPNLGQGAAQAIEDAVALGKAFNANADVTTALAAYDHTRRPQALQIQRQSARMARIALANR